MTPTASKKLVRTDDELWARVSDLSLEEFKRLRRVVAARMAPGAETRAILATIAAGLDRVDGPSAPGQKGGALGASHSETTGRRLFLRRVYDLAHEAMVKRRRTRPAAIAAFIADGLKGRYVADSGPLAALGAFIDLRDDDDVRRAVDALPAAAEVAVASHRSPKARAERIARDVAEAIAPAARFLDIRGFNRRLAETPSPRPI